MFGVSLLPANFCRLPKFHRIGSDDATKLHQRFAAFSVRELLGMLIALSWFQFRMFR
jgi:hypothetical protein